MSPRTARNKRIVLAYVKAMGSPNLPGPFRYVASDFRMSGGILTGDHGLDGAIQWRREVLHAFPDVKFRVAGALMVAEDDTVALRVTWTGTHLGTYRGLEPTGRKVEVPIYAFFRVRNGLIDREVHLTDSHALLTQLMGTPKAVKRSRGDPERAEDVSEAPRHPSDRFFVPPENLHVSWWSRSAHEPSPSSSEGGSDTGA